jgi:hypothetical protein
LRDERSFYSAPDKTALQWTQKREERRTSLLFWNIVFEREA